MCRQFHVLPSQLMNEPAEFIQLLAIETLGGDPEDGETYG